jgi:putative glutamine amidotransferase
MKHRRPVIGIPACIKMLGEHPFHAVGAKYIDAVVAASDCIPLILPAIGDQQDIAQILTLVDGILLTGSLSNVDPERYGKPLSQSNMYMDKARDATTFPLIEATIAIGKPLLGICRGFQELNVAFGGTLHQEVHAQADLMDHREKSGPLEVQYGPSHPVKITPNGYLSQILNGANEITVNSIHGQGIDQLGDHLVAEATAPDGLIEAIRVENAKNFAFAVQWHPEWKVLDNPQSQAIFKAFGDACRTSLHD